MAKKQAAKTLKGALSEEIKASRKKIKAEQRHLKKMESLYEFKYK